jgi:SET domain-containing protein
MIFEKDDKQLTLKEFEALTGASFISLLQNPKPIKSPGPEETWLGAYFKKEILSATEPDLVIRWIDPIMGWGVFANRDFKKMEYIAEYTGIVKRRSWFRSNTKNSYCFEYIGPYNIDAQEQGGVSRYINHSFQPNLASAFASIANQGHIILYTKEPIKKNTQLCYDYGPDYWKNRKPPL